jgi:pyruvate dehydrogenase E2 component (dihydrolipoamide acetyltransferase)
VRQIAKQLGVALESVTGSGPGGAISADDVKRAAAATPSAAAGGVASAATAIPATGSADAADSGAEDQRIPLRGLRRKIAEHMRHSLDTAAHFTFVAECDMTDVAAHRAGLLERAEASGIRLTYLAYVVKAMTASLREFPLLNASLDDAAAEIVIKHSIHVGIAVNTPDGLTVPIVHDADRLALLPLAREIDRLAQAARAGKLKLDELQGGTISVTSTGARGGVMATPILHHPQVAILGLHEIKPKPAVRDGKIVIRELGNLSLSLDHRVVDGAVGADFLYDVIRRLESPATWLTGQEIA